MSRMTMGEWYGHCTTMKWIFALRLVSHFQEYGKAKPVWGCYLSALHTRLLVVSLSWSQHIILMSFIHDLVQSDV
jgi:hypothetical protein